MNTDAVITGGGIGGLFTGAFLAKNGVRVTVLEKNRIIGGGLQCFRRGDRIFETGMHVMGGFTDNGTLTKICRYLGILDMLDLHHIDSGCMDEIRYGATGEVFRIPSGREAFVDAMSAYFPREAEGIRSYVDELYRISEEVPLFYLREEPEGIPVHSERFVWAADRLIAHYVGDSRLREILAYLNPLYGGVAGQTPAYIHALINVLYINGASRFVNGSQQLADALAGVIGSHGGRVLADCEVSAIAVSDRMVDYVETVRGERFTADWYISSIHPVSMFRLVPEGTFPKGFVTRITGVPDSCSAFSLFIDLKPGAFPYIDHTCYYMEDFGSIWTQAEVSGDCWPLGFMYMTPPDAGQGEFAERMLVHCIMGFDQVARWEHTSLGKRGDEYRKWKEERVAAIMRILENLFPGFGGMVANVYAASPLTVRDYFNTRNGAIFGGRKDCENLMRSQLPVFTKVRNLLLTGQNINLHGICGVPLTAINTAEAILGRNVLLKKINDVSQSV